MNRETRSTPGAADARALLARWRAAINSGDVDAITDCYSDDIVAFDAIMALEFPGKAAYRRHWQTCLDFMPAPTRFEILERQLFVDTESAVVSALVHCSCKDADGNVQGGWTRLSQHLRRIDGVWRIAHEHFSVPFDMASGRALFELEPAERAA